MIKPIRDWDPSLSSGLEKIINKCTMPNPEDRYQSCTELIYDLEHYEELDDAFKRSCLKKMRSFLICAGLPVTFAAVAIGGYIGNEREKKLNYDNLINEGYADVVQGDYEGAAGLYVDAITQVDGSRNEAYLDLLDLYINYMNDAETGLSRVTYYIDQQYDSIDKDQKLLLTVAMDYFDVLKDYKSSAYYFNMLDQKEHPEAVYYSTIALAMGELNVDYESLTFNLKNFESTNDASTISINKLMNYRLLCIVYARNLQQMGDASDRLIEAANKGLAVLEVYDDDSVKAEYYTIYNQYLALAYERLGQKYIEEDPQRSQENYEKALECCDFILGMVTAGDGKTVGSITDEKLREAKYCQKAEIYEMLQEYDKADEVYIQAEEEFGRTSIAVYAGHLSLLCKMEELKTTDVEKWDYNRLHKLYEQGQQVPEIQNDYRWKQLTQKLSPLFGKNGG